MARRRLHRDVAHPPYALTPQGHQPIPVAACEDACPCNNCSIQSYFLGFRQVCKQGRASSHLVFWSSPVRLNRARDFVRSSELTKKPSRKCGGQPLPVAARQRGPKPAWPP